MGRRLIGDFVKFKKKSRNQFVNDLSTVEGFNIELLPLSEFPDVSHATQIAFNPNRRRNILSQCFSRSHYHIFAVKEPYYFKGECNCLRILHDLGVKYQFSEEFITVVRLTHHVAGITQYSIYPLNFGYRNM